MSRFILIIADNKDKPWTKRVYVPHIRVVDKQNNKSMLIVFNSYSCGSVNNIALANTKGQNIKEWSNSEELKVFNHGEN